MPKDISITHIDDAKPSEQIGEKKKVDLTHERMFREFNINPDKLFDGTVLKQVPGDWVPLIIEQNIKSCGNIEILEAQHIKGSKVFVLIFKEELDSNKFDKEFSENMFKTINSFIESQKQKPENYHRNIVFTKSIEENKITIQY